MLKTLLLLLTLTLVHPNLNPEATAAAPAQRVAKDELQALFKKYVGLQELSVNFEQTKVLRDIPTRLTSKGQLLIQAPDLLVWTLRSPSFLEFKMAAGAAQITTGKGATASVQKLTAAQLASSPESKSLGSLASWLKFDPEFLIREYNISKNQDGSLNFQPIIPDASPFQATRVVFSKDGFVKDLLLTEKSGDRMELTFDKPVIKTAPVKGTH